MDRASKVITGLVIMNKYDGVEISAEHDIIYAGPDEDMSKEDVKELEQLGWFFDEEYECWAHFV